MAEEVDKRPARAGGARWNASADFISKPKTVPELQPDADLDPLDKAKLELEKKLDATAEK